MPSIAPSRAIDSISCSPRISVPDCFHLLLRVFPVLSVPATTPRGERLRRALEDLGPVFVKFGQLLSTRRDLLPHDIADELALLQDQVAPFPAKEAIQRIEGALGKPLNECFAEFDANPLAAASVAQVHGARLPDGSDVVVKVLRPGIEKTIDQDLRLLRHVARLLARWSRSGRRLKPVEWLQNTIASSTASSICNAKRPTPRSFGGTSSQGISCTCPRCTGR